MLLLTGASPLSLSWGLAAVPAIAEQQLFSIMIHAANNNGAAQPSVPVIIPTRRVSAR